MPDVNATPGSAFANSYVDADAAQDLADARAGGSVWDALTDDDKARSLITATQRIDSLPLLGEPTNDGQALHFPVDGSLVIPRKIVNATMLLAIGMAPYLSGLASGTTDVADPGAAPSNVKREKVDVIELEYFTPTTIDYANNALSAFPPEVQSLLASYVAGAVMSSGWGSGLAYRAS